VRQIRKPRRFLSSLAFLPVALRHRLMNLFFMSEDRRFVRQDVVIGDRKRYRPPPRLCRADGPIGKYRRYCRQFLSGLGDGTSRPGRQWRLGGSHDRAVGVVSGLRRFAGQETVKRREDTRLAARNIRLRGSIEEPNDFRRAIRKEPQKLGQLRSRDGRLAAPRKP